MKKTYIKPSELIVTLNCGAICQSLIIGSGNGSDETTGDGTDLVKEETGGTWHTGGKSVWDEEW